MILAKCRCASGVESMRSLNFLFVCVRIRSLPRVPESWARRSRKHRAGTQHFASKSHREGAKQKGLRSPVDRRAPADAAADVAVRDGFGSQALVLPLKHNKAQ